MPSFLIALLTGILATTADPAVALPERPQAPPDSRAVSRPRPEPLELPFERLGWPTLSPDGRTMAFTALDETDHSHVYVVPVTGGTPVAVTFGPWDDRSPSFSHDGAFITFVSNRSGNSDIWTAPISGGEPVQLTVDPGLDIDPAWSPDGKQLVFASNRSGVFLLYTLGPAGISPLTAGTGHDRRPAWSPDGRWIAFESNRDGEAHAWVIPSTGGQERRVGTASVAEHLPSWSADSRTLRVFAQPNRRLLLVSHLIDQVETDPSVSLILARIDLDSNPPSISRDGNTIVYLAPDRSGIGVVNFITGDGGKKISKTFGVNRHPSWSPDGLRVVFVGDFAGPRDLYTMGVGSGRTSRLTESDEREADPDWSISGGEVAYVIEGASGSSIWALEPKSGNKMLVVAERGRNRQPAWSPDDRFIAFVSDREGSDDIWIVEIGTGESWRVTALSGSETSPTWSPDGEWIAFSSDQGRGATLWKVSTRSIELESITEADGADHLHPSWNAKGSYIAFTRIDGARSGIYIVPPSGGTPFPYHSSPETRAGNPSWSPDSRHIAYEWSGRDSIMLLDIAPAPALDPER